VNESMCRGGSDPGAEAPVATADAALVAPPSAHFYPTQIFHRAVLDKSRISSEAIADLQRIRNRYRLDHNIIDRRTS